MINNGDDALLEQSAIAVVGTDMERLALGLRVSVVTWRFGLNSSVMMNWGCFHISRKGLGCTNPQFFHHCKWKRCPEECCSIKFRFCNQFLVSIVRYVLMCFWKINCLEIMASMRDPPVDRVVFSWCSRNGFTQSENCWICAALTSWRPIPALDSVMMRNGCQRGGGWPMPRFVGDFDKLFKDQKF